ncbi:MAG: hypothetical protein GY871_12780, partial [Actinomycetales bacterium]|nr:hypothetical protein [Actinomycetales bacterium]
VDAASADAIELGDLSVTNAAAAATSQLAYDDTTGAFTFTPIDISGKANVGHTHTLSDVIDAGTAAELDAPASGDAASGEVVKGDDTRLTDARTPTAHTHVLADVTDAGTSAGLDVAASGDAAAGEVVKGDDSRMTDARTPVAHTHTHTDITDFDTEAAAIADTQIGAASIGDVSDVIISGVADGDVLKWSNTTSRFEPAADAEGIALDDLSITTALASGGGTLSYDDSTGVFGFAPADMASKAAVSHTHVLADVTDAGTGAALDIPASGDAATGELVKGDDTRLTDARTPVAHTHVKADITDFDDADYAAASHTHVKADITDFDEADYAAASHTHVKADITDFDEADYAAASHTHGIADLTDFDFAMATGEDGFIATYNHTTGKIEATDPSTIALSSFDDDLDYAAAVHTHAISDVTGLQTALDAKAATSHTHTLSEITDSGTAAALDVPSSGDAANSEVVKGDDSRLTDARTPVSHTHVVADITDFDPADKADLVAGKVPTSQLPAIAISEFLGTAANETAQLALTGQEGDWCIRTDEGLTYIITTGTGSSYS